MKFRVQRDVLADAVAWTARSLPSRPPVAVLAGLLLQTTEDGLSLSGFDYEVSTRSTVAAEVAEEGQALVSGRLLADICKSLPEGPVEVRVDGTKVLLSCANARFSLLTLPVEDYPSLPEPPARCGSLPAEVLAQAVSQVAVAAGRDDTLPILTGVWVEIDGDSITMAATDRYRLAVREFGWKPEQAANATALVPARTLADATRSMTGEVELALAGGSERSGGSGGSERSGGSGGSGSDGLIGLSSSRRQMTARLLDGDFPKYQSLLPTECATQATVATAPFVEAVRRVSLVADRNTPVRLSFRDGELVLEAGSGDDAQASEAMQARLDGEDITIAFNPGYLLDALNALGTAEARLAFTVPAKPAVITGLNAPPDSGGAAGNDEPGAEYRHLLMPVRLSG